MYKIFYNRSAFIRSFILSAIVTALFCGSVSGGQKKYLKVNVNELINLAKTDHIGLFEWSMSNYREHVTDYTATLHRQERIKRKLDKLQEISVWFREAPFSLLMKWEKNADMIDKLLYVEGYNDDKMLVHPTGLFSFVKSVKRAPDSPDAKKASLLPCDRFGFYRSMQDIVAILKEAKKENALGGRYLGFTKSFGRKCVSIKIDVPERKDNPCSTMTINFDAENGLPISMKAFDCYGKIICNYAFEDLEINPGITGNTFSARTNRL